MSTILASFKSIVQIFRKRARRYCSWYYFKKSVAVVSLTCFLLNTLWTSGYSSIEMIQDKDKYKLGAQSQLRSGDAYLSPKRMNADGGMLKILDKNENKVYLINEMTKEVAGIEDLKTGLTTRFLKDANGKTFTRVFDKTGAEVAPGQPREGQSAPGIAAQMVNAFQRFVARFTAGENTEGRRRENAAEKSDEKTKQKQVSQQSFEQTQNISVTKDDKGKGTEESQSSAQEAAVTTNQGVQKQEDENATKYTHVRVGKKLDDAQSVTVVNMLKIQEMAEGERFNLNLIARELSPAQMEQALKAGGIIAHLKNKTEGGADFFAAIAEDGTVALADLDGNIIVTTLEDFNKEFGDSYEWTGKILQLGDAGELETISPAVKESTKGAFYEELLQGLSDNIPEETADEDQIKWYEVGKIFTRFFEVVRDAVLPEEPKGPPENWEKMTAEERSKWLKEELNSKDEARIKNAKEVFGALKSDEQAAIMKSLVQGESISVNSKEFKALSELYKGLNSDQKLALLGELRKGSPTSYIAAVLEVTSLYENVLGRSPEQAGLDGWVDAYRNGLSYADMVRGFFRSTEFSNRSADQQIAALYRVLLGREPDAEGLKNYVSKYVEGDASFQEIANEIMNGKEFASKSKEHKDYVKSMKLGSALGDIYSKQSPSSIKLPDGWDKMDAAKRAEWLQKELMSGDTKRIVNALGAFRGLSAEDKAAVLTKLIGQTPNEGSDSYKVMNKLFYNLTDDKKLEVLHTLSKDKANPVTAIHLFKGMEGGAYRNLMFAAFAKEDTKAAARVLANWKNITKDSAAYGMLEAAFDADKDVAKAIVDHLKKDTEYKSLGETFEKHLDNYKKFSEVIARYTKDGVIDYAGLAKYLKGISGDDKRLQEAMGILKAIVGKTYGLGVKKLLNAIEDEKLLKGIKAEAEKGDTAYKEVIAPAVAKRIESVNKATNDPADEKAASKQVVKQIESWLNEYLNADPAKKAQMAATLGLSVDQLANLSAEGVQKIIKYLNEQAELGQIINCATEAFSTLAQLLGNAVDGAINKFDFALKAILVDILTGTINEGTTDEQLQLSMFSIKTVAEKSYNLTLNGAKDVTMDDLKKANDPVIAHVGGNHYVVVTGIKDGQVTYIENGEEKTMSEEDFGEWFTGHTLSTENIGGTAMNNAELMAERGASEAGDAGDAAWDAAKQAGASDEDARRAAENAYNQAAAGGASTSSQDAVNDAAQQANPGVDRETVRAQVAQSYDDPGQQASGPEASTFTAGDAGDNAWNQTMQQIINDGGDPNSQAAQDRARAAAEAAYNNAAANGAFVPWARDSNGNMINLDSIGDSINKNALAQGIDNIDGMRVTDYSSQVVDSLFNASVNGYALEARVMNEIKNNPSMDPIAIGEKLFNNQKYVDFFVNYVNKTVSSDFVFDQDTMKINHMGQLEGVRISDLLGQDANIATGDNLLSIDNDVTAKIVLGPKGTFSAITQEDAKASFRNETTGEVTEGMLLAGSTLTGTRGKKEMVVATGEFKFKDDIEILKKESKGEGATPEVKTNAKIIEKDDRYILSDGIVSIRNDKMAVVGKGTVFKEGSQLADGTVVKSGDLKLANFDEKGNRIFVAANASDVVYTENISEKNKTTTVMAYDWAGLREAYTEYNKGASLENLGIDATLESGEARTYYEIGRIKKDGEEYKAIKTVEKTDAQGKKYSSLEIRETVFKDVVATPFETDKQVVNFTGDGISAKFESMEINGTINHKTGESSLNIVRNISIETVKDDGSKVIYKTNKMVAVDGDGSLILVDDNGTTLAYHVKGKTIKKADDTYYVTPKDAVMRTAYEAQDGVLRGVYEDIKLGAGWERVNGNYSAFVGEEVVGTDKGYFVRKGNTWVKIEVGQKINGWELAVQDVHETDEEEKEAYKDSVSLSHNAYNVAEGQEVVFRKTGRLDQVFDKNRIDILGTADGKLTLDTAVDVDATLYLNGKTSIFTTADTSANYNDASDNDNLGILKEGAEFAIGKDAQGRSVIVVGKGEFLFNNTIEIAKGKSGGSGTMAEVNTHGKIIDKEDRYIISDGGVSIRGGQMTVIGKGTVFHEGSQLRDGTTVVSGQLKIADFSDGNPLYVSAGVTARTVKGTLEVGYNSQGVTYARASKRVNAVDVMQNVPKGATVTGTITATTYFGTKRVNTDSGSYNVLATDAQGNLIATGTVNYYNNVNIYQKVEYEAKKTEDVIVGYDDFIGLPYYAPREVTAKVTIISDVTLNGVDGKNRTDRSSTSVLITDTLKIGPMGPYPPTVYTEKNVASMATLDNGQKLFVMNDGKGFVVGTNATGADTVDWARSGREYTTAVVDNTRAVYRFAGFGNDAKIDEQKSGTEIKLGNAWVRGNDLQQAVGARVMAVNDGKNDGFYTYANDRWQKMGGAGGTTVGDWNLSSDGRTLQRKEVGGVTLYDADNKAVKLTEVKTADSNLTASLKGQTVSQTIGFDGKFMINGEFSAHYAPSDVDGLLKNIEIKAGVDKNNNLTAVINNGEFHFSSQRMEIAMSQGGAGGALPKVETNARIKEDKDNNRYILSGNNAVVSIRNGAFAVVGEGTVFREGSMLADVGEVKSGDLKLAGTDAKGNRIFIAANGQAVTSAGLTDERTKESLRTNLVVTYNANGVTEAKLVYLEGSQQNVGGLQGKLASKDKDGSIITVLDTSGKVSVNTTDGKKEFNVIALDEKGGYKAIETIYNNAVLQAEAEGTDEQGRPISLTITETLNGSYFHNSPDASTVKADWKITDTRSGAIISTRAPIEQVLDQDRNPLSSSMIIGNNGSAYFIGYNKETKQNTVSVVKAGTYYSENGDIGTKIEVIKVGNDHKVAREGTEGKIGGVWVDGRVMEGMDGKAYFARLNAQQNEVTDVRALDRKDGKFVMGEERSGANKTLIVGEDSNNTKILASWDGKFNLKGLYQNGVYADKGTLNFNGQEIAVTVDQKENKLKLANPDDAQGNTFRYQDLGGVRREVEIKAFDFNSKTSAISVTGELKLNSGSAPVKFANTNVKTERTSEPSSQGESAEVFMHGTLNMVQDENDKSVTFNVKDGTVELGVTFALEYGLSGKLDGNMDLAYFTKGTRIIAGSDVDLNVDTGDPEAVITRKVHKGTTIDIKVEGGISSNLQNSKGSITDTFILNGQEANTRIIENGQVKSQTTDRVFIGSKYIDLKTTGFELKADNYAETISKADIDKNKDSLVKNKEGLWEVKKEITMTDAKGNAIQWLAEGSLITVDGGVVKNNNFQKHVMEPLQQNVPGFKGAGDFLGLVGKGAGFVAGKIGEGVGFVAGKIGEGVGFVAGKTGELIDGAATWVNENKAAAMALSAAVPIAAPFVGAALIAKNWDKITGTATDIWNNNIVPALDGAATWVDNNRALAIGISAVMPVAAPFVYGALAVKNWGAITSTVGEKWSDFTELVGTTWKNNIVPALDGAATWINNNKALALTLSAVVPIAAPFVGAALAVKNWDAISDAAGSAWKGFTDGLGGIWNGISDAAAGAWKGLTENELVRNITGFASPLLNDAANWLNNNKLVALGLGAFPPFAPIVGAVLLIKNNDAIARAIKSADSWIRNNVINSLGLQGVVDFATFGGAMLMSAAAPPLAVLLMPKALETATGKAIMHWMGNNWDGLLAATATGAGVGALVGGVPTGGIGAIPGAIIGGLLGAGGYILGSALSGGKGGGFTGNNIIDGIINGVISGATLGLGSGVSLLAPVSTKLATMALSKGAIGFASKSLLAATKVLNPVLNPFSLSMGKGAAGLSAKAATSLLGAARVESMFATPFLGGLARFSVNSAGALMKFGVPMAKNAVLYGQFGAIPGLPSFNGLLPSAFQAVTGIDLASNPVYQAVANMAFFGPFLASGMVGQKVAGAGSQGSLAGSLAKGFNTVKQAVFHPRETLGRASTSGMFNFGKKALSLDTMKVGATAFRGNKMGFVRAAMSEIGENIINIVPNTTRMVSDIAVFNTVTGVIGGAINTALGGEERQWWIFNLPKFNSWTDAITKTSNIVKKSITDPQVWLFSLGVGVASPLLTPLLRNMPILGPIMRKVGEKEVFVGGRFAEGRFGRFQRFVYEEGFQEQIPEMLAGNLFAGNQQASEIFQELFDRRGRGFRPNAMGNHSVSSQMLSGNAPLTQAVRTYNNNPTSANLNAVMSSLPDIGLAPAAAAGLVNNPQSLNSYMALSFAVNNGLVAINGDAQVAENMVRALNNVQASLASDLSFSATLDILSYSAGAIHELTAARVPDLKLEDLTLDTLARTMSDNAGSLGNATPVVRFAEATAVAGNNGATADLLAVVHGQVARLQAAGKVTSGDVAALNNLLSALMRGDAADKDAHVLGVLADLHTALSVVDTSGLNMEDYTEFLLSFEELNQAIDRYKNPAAEVLFAGVLLSRPDLSSVAGSLSTPGRQLTLVKKYEALGRFDLGKLSKIDFSKIGDVDTRIALFNSASLLYRYLSLADGFGGFTARDLATMKDLVSSLNGMDLSSLSKEYRAAVEKVIAKALNRVNFVVNGLQMPAGSGDPKGKILEAVGSASDKFGIQLEKSNVDGELLAGIQSAIASGKPDELITFIEKVIRENREKLGDHSFSGLQDHQKEAFRSIFTELFEKSSGEASGRYTHILRTGGGKGYIALFTILSMLQEAQEKGTFITYFTNTGVNADQFFTKYLSIFGEALGNVVRDADLRDEEARKDPAKLREKLRNATIVVTTYDTWAGLEAQDFAVLLANESPEFKEIATRNRELLTRQHKIAVDIDPQTGRVSFSNPTDSKKAMEILVAQDYNKPLLAQTIIPHEKVGDAVADEIDFFSTIPLQALASSMGKVYKSSLWIEYYTDLLEGKRSVGEMLNAYGELGISLDRMNEDRNTGKAHLEKMIELHREIDTQVAASVAADGTVTMSVDSLVEKVFERSSTAVSREEAKKIIEARIKDFRTMKYWENLVGVSDELKPQFSRFKGDVSRKVGGRVRQAQEGATGKFWNNILVRLGSRDDTQDAKTQELRRQEMDALQEKVRQEKESSKGSDKVDAHKLVQGGVDRLKKNFGDLFTDSEMAEHVRNAVAAAELKKDKEYYIKDGRIIVTNLGKGVENLSLPSGQMQYLEVKHGDQVSGVSKPIRETYISNSVAAMSVFNRIIGLTGTLTPKILESVLSPMGFKVGGAGELMKVGNNYVLSATLNETARTIVNAVSEMDGEGIVNFNFIGTPDSNISMRLYRSILSQILGTELSEETMAEIAANSAKPENIRMILTGLGITDGKLIDRALAVRYVGPGVTDGELSQMERDVQSGRLQYLISDAFLTGRGWDAGDMRTAFHRFVAAQIVRKTLLEAGVDTATVESVVEEVANSADLKKIAEDFAAYKNQEWVQKSDDRDALISGKATEAREGTANAIERIVSDKVTLGSTDLENIRESILRKVQVTLYAVEPELMTETQIKQLLGRIDPYGSNRFDESFYGKDIISMASIEMARELESLRNAINSEAGGEWSAEVLFSNLEKLWAENEEAALRKAGQKIALSRQRSYEEQQKPGATTAGEAVKSLTDAGLSEEDAKAIVEKLSAKEQGAPAPRAGTADARKLTREEQFTLNNVIRLHQILTMLDPEAARVIVGGLTEKDIELLRDGDPAVMVQLALDKAAAQQGTEQNVLTAKLKNVIATVRELAAARQEVQAQTAKLTEKQRQEIIEAQNGKPSLMQRLILSRKYGALFSANKKAADLEKKLSEQVNSIAEILLETERIRPAIPALNLLLSITADEEGNVVFDEEKLARSSEGRKMEQLQAFIEERIPALFGDEKPNWKNVTFGELTDLLAQGNSLELLKRLLQPRGAASLSLGAIISEIERVAERRVEEMLPVYEQRYAAQLAEREKEYTRKGLTPARAKVAAREDLRRSAKKDVLARMSMGDLARVAATVDGAAKPETLRTALLVANLTLSEDEAQAVVEKYNGVLKIVSNAQESVKAAGITLEPGDVEKLTARQLKGDLAADTIVAQLILNKIRDNRADQALDAMVENGQIKPEAKEQYRQFFRMDPSLSGIQFTLADIRIAARAIEGRQTGDTPKDAFLEVALKAADPELSGRSSEEIKDMLRAAGKIEYYINPEHITVEMLSVQGLLELLQAAKAKGKSVVGQAQQEGFAVLNPVAEALRQSLDAVSSDKNRRERSARIAQTLAGLSRMTDQAVLDLFSKIIEQNGAVAPEAREKLSMLLAETLKKQAGEGMGSPLMKHLLGGIGFAQLMLEASIDLPLLARQDVFARAVTGADEGTRALLAAFSGQPSGAAIVSESAVLQAISRYGLSAAVDEQGAKDLAGNIVQILSDPAGNKAERVREAFVASNARAAVDINTIVSEAFKGIAPQVAAEAGNAAVSIAEAVISFIDSGDGKELLKAVKEASQLLLNAGVANEQVLGIVESIMSRIPALQPVSDGILKEIGALKPVKGALQLLEEAGIDINELLGRLEGEESVTVIAKDGTEKTFAYAGRGDHAMVFKGADVAVKLVESASIQQVSDANVLVVRQGLQDEVANYVIMVKSGETGYERLKGVPKKGDSLVIIQQQGTTVAEQVAALLKKGDTKEAAAVIQAVVDHINRLGAEGVTYIPSGDILSNMGTVGESGKVVSFDFPNLKEGSNAQALLMVLGGVVKAAGEKGLDEAQYAELVAPVFEALAPMLLSVDNFKAALQQTLGIKMAGLIAGLALQGIDFDDFLYDTRQGVIIVPDKAMPVLGKTLGMENGKAFNFLGYVVVSQSTFTEANKGNQEERMIIAHEKRHNDYDTKQQAQDAEQVLMSELYAYFASFIDVYGAEALADERQVQAGKGQWWQIVAGVLGEEYVKRIADSKDITGTETINDLRAKLMASTYVIDQAIRKLGADMALKYLLASDNLDAILAMTDAPSLQALGDWVKDTLGYGFEVKEYDAHREEYQQFKKQYADRNDGKTKALTEDLSSPGERARHMYNLAVEKLLLGRGYTVMKGKESEVALKLVLGLFKNTGEMFRSLTGKDAKAFEALSPEQRDQEILRSFVIQSARVVESVEKGALTLREGEIQMTVFKILKDLLIAANRDDNVKSILEEATVDAKALATLGQAIRNNETVAGMSLAGVVSQMNADSRGKADIGVSREVIARIRAEIEQQRSPLAKLADSVQEALGLTAEVEALDAEILGLYSELKLDDKVTGRGALPDRIGLAKMAGAQ